MTRLSIPSLLFAALLALSACGSTSDAGTSDAGTSDAGETTSETTGEAASDGADGDASGVSTLDELPEECRQPIAEFLRAIEPAVSEVDWENATMADVEGMGSAVDAPGTELDTALADAGCEDLQPDTDAEALSMMIELAEDEAPGTVSWLRFIGTFASVVPGAGVSDDLPADCDGAIAYAEGLTADAESMMDLPVSELANLGAVVETIQSECSPEQANTFLETYATFVTGE